MVKLICGGTEITVNKEEAEKIIRDQEIRKTLYPKMTAFWELKDKELSVKDGVIVKSGKGDNREETKQSRTK